MRIRINISFQINRVIKYLIISDLLFLGSWSLIQPIFPLFVINKISGGSIIIVGITVAIYWLVKSTLQIPIARYLDKTEGEKDEFYALVIGLILSAAAAFILALIKELWELFVVQSIYAVAMALYIPSWSSIFSRHLDEKRYSFDWSLDGAIVGYASFVATFASGFLAYWFGFSFVFILIGVASLGSAIVIFFAPDIVMPEKPKGNHPIIRDRTPANIAK